MAFGEGSSSSNYGTQSGRQQGEAPLRSRQSKSSSPAPTGSSSSSSDLLFSHAQSSFDEFPYPPYSELPFTSLKRRKQSSSQNHHKIIKWAMRGVLLSPVIVLVVWSIGAMIFSKNVNHKSNNKYNNRMNNASSSMRSRSNQRMMTMMGVPQQQQAQANNLYGNVMMPPQQQMYAMMPPQQQLQQQSSPQMGNANMVMTPNNYAMNPPMATPPQQQMMAPPQQASNMVVQPQVFQQSQQPAQQQPMMMMTMPQQGQVVADSQAMAISPPAQAQEQPQQAVMQAAVAQEQQPLAQEGTIQEEPLAMQEKPSMGSTGGATVLYYDPQQTTLGEYGQVRLPSTVYDTQGNPVDLASLANTSQGQILLETPRQQASSLPIQGAVASEAAPRTLMATPQAQMAAPDLKKWGESTSQDQSIIVGTVAVMALLVGALSARRLRSRSVLSACIENESLEDDVAYDAAYSTTMPQHAAEAGSSYNTFGGGWKGDLEKFDV